MKKFQGVITALITPFKDNKIDEKAFENIIERQIKSGVNGVVVCGTTGESPTLSHEEHNKVTALCVEIVSGRIPVMAGTGSNSTQEAIELSRAAQKVKVDATLIVTPYYNKPGQEGIYQHFKAINDSIDIPVYIYNIPGRSVVDINDKTIARIAELKNVVGIKDATADLSRITKLRQELKSDDFTFLSGEDITALSFNAQGGDGVISVTSNLIPEQLSKIQNLWREGNLKEALKIHESIAGLHFAMFCDSNPVPVKYAMSLTGICTDEVRLPLFKLSEDKKLLIKKTLTDLDLL